MTDRELAVVEKMSQCGGSFVHALADCFHRADTNNFKKLKNAFSEYWEQYERLADKQ